MHIGYEGLSLVLKTVAETKLNMYFKQGSMEYYYARVTLSYKMSWPLIWTCSTINIHVLFS